MAETVRKALEEIRDHIGAAGKGSALLAMIEEALASNDNAEMHAALKAFDGEDTIVIQRMRQEGEATDKPAGGDQ